METKENKTTKIILTVLISLLVLIVAGIAFVVVSGKMKENNYTAAIEEGQKYMAENNYEQAILQFQKAMSLDPEEEDAYLALADVYMQQDNSSRASAILRRGYEKTNSLNIQRKLNEIETQTLTAKAGDEDGEVINLAEASQDIAWDTSFVQKIVDYTFEDYKREFGQVVSAEMDKDGYLEVRHTKLNAVCYYQNTSDNKEIVDTSRKLPYETGMPAKITLDSLGILFRNFEGGASLSRMQMLFGERVVPKTLEGRPYIENKEEDLIARIETDSEGNITSATSWNELILPLANQKKTSAGTLAGVVVDAVTGKGVPSATLKFEPRSSSHSTLSKTTDSKGAFRVELEADDYKITVKCDGYITEVFSFTIKKGESYSGVQFVISPELSGEARIVLEWGAQPRDLDSHLTGSVDGGSNIHVFFGDQRATSGGAAIADLDLDDTDGYGPETTTIHNLEGVYTFSVVDFLETGTMAQEGATVKIYLPGQDPVTVQLGSGSGVNNVWEVCKIDHGRLEVLNRAGSDSDF